MKELNPELKEFYVEDALLPMIRHPYVYVVPFLGTEIEIEQANKRYQYMTEKLKTSLKKKHYEAYVFLHERPYRLEAFTEIMNYLLPSEYWSILSNVWYDSENIWQNKKVWKSLFLNEKRYKKFFMTEREQRFFDKLPTHFKVYRGCHEGKNEHGFSYSLDKEQAIWFSKRFLQGHENPKLIERFIDKKDVFAYIDRRNEQEIIIIN